MKGSETKRLILEKAIELFYKYGYVKASIRNLVKSAGITNSTVYLYFKSKDELLYHIILEIGNTLLSELNTAIQRNEDPINCLREMIFRQVCLLKTRRMEVKIYIEEQYQLPPRYRKKALKQHRQIYDIYYKKICELKKMKMLRDVDPTVATFSIFAAMNWAYRWFREDGTLSVEDVAEQIISIYFGGILKPEYMLKKR